ncbi:MAG: tetratricopeptide repeat protein [Chitinophagales bacterium]
MDRLPQLLEFLNENPDDSFVQYAIALEYIKKGETDKARKQFEDLVNKDPDYVGTYYHLGKLYARLSLRAEALSCYAQGITIARKLQDQHSMAELQNAKLNLEMGLDDEDET